MNTMKLIGTAVIVFFFTSTINEAQSSANLNTIPSAGPTISIDDVGRFYRVYHAANGHPSADQIQQDYLDEGSAWLLQFAKMRHISGASIAKNMAEHPGPFSIPPPIPRTFHHYFFGMGLICRGLLRALPCCG